MVVGCKVTLNQKNSYLFLDTLITLVLPHLTDFKGFSFNKKSKSILSFSIKNLLTFPELKDEFLNFSNLPSMHITIQTTSNNVNESKILLNSFNFPIIKE
jgi:ribosomal protein L5